MWHKHTSAECYKNPSNSSAPSITVAAPSSSSPQTVARLAVSHILYASDDEDTSNNEDPFLYSLDISDVANDESL